MADDRFGELAAQDQYAPTAYLPDVLTGPDEPVSTERQRSQRAAQFARQGEGVNPVVDIIKSIPAAAARGAKSFLLQAGSGMDPIPFMPEVSQEQQRLGMEGTHEAERQIEEGIKANLYQPQTTPGHYGHSVVEIGANPINWVGPGSIPFKAGWNVASGLGGEAGAQAYKGTPYEDTARTVGSFSPMVAERAAALAPGALARLPGAVLPMAAPERITGAAYRIGDRNFAAPVHSMAAEDAMSALGVKREMDLIDRQPGVNLSEKLAAHHDAQGFVTSSGRFLTRDEAQRFAADTGQIRAGAQGRISGLNAEDISGQAGDAARAENRRIVGELAAQDVLPQAIRRQDVVRDRSGRPIRTAPLPIGTEPDILEAGLRRVSEPERIVGAAVKGDNRVFAADQHWGAANEAGRYYNVEDPIGAGLLKDVEHDGFLTNKGRYVNREEALRIAQAAGQSQPGSLARQGRLETSETRLRLEDREGREAALAAINARLRGEPQMQAERRMGRHRPVMSDLADQGEYQRPR